MIQSESECLTNGGCSESPPPPLSRGTVTPSKYGAANCEADPGSPTSTRTVHPILDPHELMSRRLKLLAAIQAEMPEFARLVEARNHLSRQTELCRSFLETGQMQSEGQQRLEQVVQMREQLEAELNAQQLRLAEAGREMESLDSMAAALNAKLDKQSAALDKIAEPLAVRTRVAEEAMQPLISPKMSGDVGPSDRGMIDGPSSMQGSANAFAAGSEAKRADEPLVAPMSEGGMHTLNTPAQTCHNDGR